MGLFDRLTQVIRANLNSWLNTAEDPEVMLTAAIAELQEEMIQLRQAVAQAIATQKRTERQHRQADQQSQTLYAQAEVALREANESFARELLKRRQTLAETTQLLEAQLQPQQDVVAQLKQDLQTLEGKLAAAKARRDLYVARARSAQASQRLTEVLNQLDGGQDQTVFTQMEDHVLNLEANAQAIAALHQDSLENRIANLSSPTVDTELQQLRQKVQAEAAQLQDVQQHWEPSS